MSKVVIFGGTAEGRERAEALLSQGEECLVCVTSPYARELLPRELPCHVGAMDFEKMRAFLSRVNPCRVIDATHPYALRATENIRTACRELGLPCERVLREREEGAWRQMAEHVKGPEEAARAAERVPGRILLTTGSHTLDVYAARIAPERLFVRVLPTVEALDLCRLAGIAPSHILAMQGPFSRELNGAVYDQYGISVLVTKDSGARGGVSGKVIPALERDIHVILIERPEE